MRRKGRTKSRETIFNVWKNFDPVGAPMDANFIRIGYGDCLRRSERVNWELSDFESIELDFSRPFLPEALAQVKTIKFLTPDERLWLNQIRGYTYAYLFRFVEEYIVGLVDSLSIDRRDPVEVAALTRFKDEEIKHQRLFEFFEQKFKSGFPVSCELVGNMEEVAKAILDRGRLAVLILTSMLEWLTQAHYLAYFHRESDDVDIDPAFAQLFRLHWVEEAQHAYLDTLEIARELESTDRAERKRAIAEFLNICDDFFGILCVQARLDLKAIQAASDRVFDDVSRARILLQQTSAYFDTFIRLGLLNRNFRKVVRQIAPDGDDALDGYLRGHDDERK